MQKNKKSSRRTKNLVMICAFTAMILTVSTYAWFIGLQTVHVTSFDINVKAADSLALSLDGITFGESVTISKETLETITDTYATNTNSWGGEEGLIPVSTVGEMDEGTSRMVLYEKSSFTPTQGGYRVMSSKLDNSTDEQDGYVVFDLFVRNYSGEHYYVDLNEDQEEAIYLTTDSSVVVGQNGQGGTGIENSVRVAFTQVGRIIGTSTDSAKIQGISCTGDGDVTGICRDAQIWEPNDKKHEANALNYYKTSCLLRTAEDTYAGACPEITDGQYVHTYAFNSEFEENPVVDAYDGADLNSYTGSTSLTEFDYFTDEEKEFTGMARPQFMTLAPNSITKLRVYVYIEGQDIDNYNFSQVGKQISVNFGFTKERFTEEDVDYDGPVLPTSVGTCTDGTVPTDRADCESKKGVWNSSSRTCTIGTFEACVAIGATDFTPTFANGGEAGTIEEGEFVPAG